MPNIKQWSDALWARSRAKWIAFFALGAIGASVIALLVWCASMALLFHFAAPPD
jgi:hypothetical protein